MTDLFTIWGADVRLDQEKLWTERVRPLVQESSPLHELRKHFIKCNLFDFIDEIKLNRNYGEYITNANWWGAVQHGLGLTSLVAPLSAYHGIGKILIASSHSQEFDRPWGSSPEIDNNIRWSGTVVTHDGYHRTRQRKIQEIIAPFVQSGRTFPIASCYRTGRGSKSVNCGNCEKCVRTEAGLLVAGLDPNSFGFDINERTLSKTMERFLGGRLRLGPTSVFHWQDIQRDIPTCQLRKEHTRAINTWDLV